MPNAFNPPVITETEAVIAEKPKNPSKKSKKQKNQNNNQDRNNFNQSRLCNKNCCSRSAETDYTINRKKRNFYTRCGSLLYNFSKCYLTLG